MGDFWIILLLLALIFLMGVFIYNRIVALRQARGNAFADIDVQLKQRADLIPNLVETVKSFAAHEKDVFNQVTAVRSQAYNPNSFKDRIAHEAQLGQALMNLMAVAENYPAIKADQNFQKLQAELADIENKIAAARRFFNNTTAEYNTAIQQFPGVLVARFFHFGHEEFFDVPEAERASMGDAPKINFD